MSMLMMVEAEWKTEVREEVSNFLFTDPDVNGEEGGGGVEDRGEGGGEKLSLYLTQTSMVKMVEAKSKTEVREEVSNFLFI